VNFVKTFFTFCSVQVKRASQFVKTSGREDNTAAAVNQWKVQGMGMIPGATISGPSPSKKKKDKAAEKSEQARKGWFEIQDYSKTDPEILDRFLTFVSKERTLRQPASSFTVEGETLQGPSRLKKGNSKRNQMPTDHRKRQRS